MRCCYWNVRAANSACFIFNRCAARRQLVSNNGALKALDISRIKMRPQHCCTFHMNMPACARIGTDAKDGSSNVLILL